MPERTQMRFFADQIPDGWVIVEGQTPGVDGSVLCEKLPPETPVKGYRVQGPETLALVNSHKEMEEAILRRLDIYKKDLLVDKRWLNIARTDLEKGFMALNRAIMRPERVSIPEIDYAPPTNG